MWLLRHFPASCMWIESPPGLGFSKSITYVLQVLTILPVLTMLLVLTSTTCVTYVTSIYKYISCITCVAYVGITHIMQVLPVLPVLPVLLIISCFTGFKLLCFIVNNNHINQLYILKHLHSITRSSQNNVSNSNFYIVNNPVCRTNKNGLIACTVSILVLNICYSKCVHVQVFSLPYNYNTHICIDYLFQRDFIH